MVPACWASHFCRPYIYSVFSSVASSRPHVLITLPPRLQSEQLGEELVLRFFALYRVAVPDYKRCV